MLLAKWRVIGRAEWLLPLHSSMEEAARPTRVTPWGILIKEMEGGREGKRGGGEMWLGGGAGSESRGRTLREDSSGRADMGEWGELIDG